MRWCQKDVRRHTNTESQNKFRVHAEVILRTSKLEMNPKITIYFKKVNKQDKYSDKTVINTTTF